MGALRVPATDRDRLPDYLPARMVNEFAYCPRLFFYEFVEGVFRESADTVEGSAQHQRVDRKADPLARAEELPETIHARSVTLSSERLRVIATKRKLATLEGRPLLVDSGDAELDASFPAAVRVWAGYKEELLYPLGWESEA